MDDSNMHANDRKSGPNTNGSTRRSLGSSQLQQGSPVRPTSLMDSPSQHPGAYTIIQVVVNRDDKGYGMKVSGDNPVYVQSVKQGGAAEKAGLYAGDKIIEVNGENVMSSTHTDVVGLIRSASQVVLTVQQRIRGKRMESPSLQTSRSMTSPSSHQITGPQPVDHEKMHQLQVEKKQHIRLMMEKEERYLEMLRSQLALSPNEKKCAELEKTERNLHKLQGMLQGNLVTNEQSPPLLSRNIFTDIPPLQSSQTLPSKTSKSGADVAPPLPRRNRSQGTHPDSRDTNGNRRSPNYANGTRGPKNINNNNSNNNNKGKCFVKSDGRVVDDQVPPPLPPRNQPRAPVFLPDFELDAANSIGKQLSYPLVTTCATLINNYTSNHAHHHRTKSSPDSLLMMTPAEASRRLIASESTTDLGADGFGENATPPGTPPPPYPHASPEVTRKMGNANRECEVDLPDDHDCSFSTSSILDTSNIALNSSDIKAASSHVAQQQIISMEDDEMSDQEVNQLDDHGPFKSLSRLWEHRPHLAVFMNYVLLNSDPNSLLFYLLTNLYKEGNAKDMRKWAYEIHSSFLVPGAPLRLANVDENIAHEIDDNLMREYDKEEILRKIFWKPRARAKDELTRQLNHFQQKRTAGLGTMYGPPDAKLYDMNHEKARELKIYENLLVDKLEPYLEEVERETYDPKKYYTAAALATVIIRIFGVRAVHPLDRFPTFVNKEKAFRPKFMNMKYSRKLTIQGHQFTAQQYYTVIACNHCHQIIYGIGPQGYQCSVCLINLHRMCVRLFEDSCPGPINKKDRGIQKVMEKIHRRKPSNQTQLDRRQDDKDAESADAGDMKASHSLTRTDSDRRPDAKTDVPAQDGQDHGQNHEEDATNIESTKSLPPAQSDKKKNSSSINRSESVKESSEKQKKQRRNFSDPLRPHNIGDSANLDTAAFWSGSTGSSSNSSINSNSRCSNDSPSMGNTGCDSDGINEADLNDWLSGLTPEEQHRIPPHEKQRQEIINELLSTEISHVRNLGILDRVFLRGIKERGLLKEDELQLIFPNLPEVKKIHSNFAKLLRTKKSSDGALWKDIGEILLEMFNGTLGESFQKAAATFCEKQQGALDLIKEKRRKDPKFSVGLNELEQNRECRRLPLQGFILSEMQRLSKYPLIIERLIGTIEKNANVQDGVEYSDAELGNLTLAAERAREIINHVNEAAKRAWGKLRLQEIQSHLDTTQFTASKDFAIVNEFKTIDLTTYTLLHEGLVLLKRQNKAHQPLHMLLLEEAVIFLVRDGDQRFVLKFFQCGKPGQPLLPPIIKISSTLIFRPNAATDCSLFLVNTSTQNSNMYELLTKDNSERKTWIMHLSKALEPFNARDGRAKNPTEPSSEGEETVADLPNIGDVAERAETIGGGESAPGETEEPQNNESGNEDKPASSVENEDTSSDNDTVGGGVSTKFTADDWPLIQPSEVHANIPPVHYADAVLTPIEQLNRKNDEVRKALEDREKLVADLFNIPRDDYHHIMDMAHEESKNETEVVSKEPTELVLTSLYQLDQLLKAVNESYVVTDADEVLLKSGGKGQSCASNPNHAKKEFIPQAASIIHGVQGSLTQLLSVMKSREEERSRLRKELERTREQLHAKLALECSTYAADTTEEGPPDLVQSGDLESIQESLTENDAN